ncbi:unnamed protein product [Amaranthus hypochondriacus]
MPLQDFVFEKLLMGLKSTKTLFFMRLVVVGSPRGFVIWNRPPPVSIKINVDGDFSSLDEKHVEARVVLWAMDLAKEHHWQNVIIEGNCKMVVETLPGSRDRVFMSRPLTITVHLLVMILYPCHFSLVIEVVIRLPID